MSRVKSFTSNLSLVVSICLKSFSAIPEKEIRINILNDKELEFNKVQSVQKFKLNTLWVMK